eukprot:TRINITY_DN141_c0_g1_i14.p1 TRINITY_DN141_c0_g1~~TRINITY_DN141_c0_g1_i14.p1  ORF type:complete len:174 (+),score=14.22 TRINITY_DN141_c0_g1_i14:83-604(+)
MNHVFAAMMASFAAEVRGYETLCLGAKLRPMYAPCGLSGIPGIEDMRQPACTPECEAAWEEAWQKVDGSCCSYYPDPAERSSCAKTWKRLGSRFVIAYHKLCSKNLRDFNTALLEMLSFGFHPDDENVAAVRAAPVKLGLIAVSGAAAGAIGACVALAIAYWSPRKQEILLAH